MTLGEFKAWLDGYAEGFDGAPTPEQWAKVREKLEGVQADVISLGGSIVQPTPFQYPTVTSVSVGSSDQPYECWN